jgi:hypothetical protein
MLAGLQIPTVLHLIKKRPISAPASAPAITDRARASNVGLALAASGAKCTSHT